MNEQQARFCAEYIVDHNGTQAAIRAGYSEKTAAPIASRLLRDVKVRNKIAELEDRIPKRNTIATAQEVLEHFTAVMRGEKFDEVVKREEDGTLHKIEVTAKLSDRNKAAEALAKHYALLVEKVELTKPKTELADEIEAVLHGR